MVLVTVLKHLWSKYSWLKLLVIIWFYQLGCYWIGQSKEIWKVKLTFRALAICRICSDAGLTLETSVSPSESLYGGQFTLTTLWYSPPTEHHSFFRKLPSLLELDFFARVKAVCEAIERIDFSNQWMQFLYKTDWFDNTMFFTGLMFIIYLAAYVPFCSPTSSCFCPFISICFFLRCVFFAMKWICLKC